MKKVLIVVDMLNDFCTEGGALYFSQAENIKKNVKSLIDEYRENNDPIIYLNDNHDEDDKEFERFDPHAFDEPGGLMIPELEFWKEGRGYVIPKKRYSGFYNTKLDETLKILKPELVEVVGVCTSICVMDTVGGLANRDYRVRVITDAVADFDSDMHDMAITRMSFLYGAETWTLNERKELD